ncbi:alanine racemase [Anditalea andensis]|uniref:Alanine racemase n=1 Tax=Anditalea andensis TaxID=1048983 RepID=A0A074LHE9_9BACT|nr:alanine racemase [Anditalea andensis]KEO73207.1 alanine racemase [Anditalea andensis]
MQGTSYIEISRSAYRKNLKFMRSQVGEKPILSAVIKGNAYGHGIENMVKIAEEAGIRHFSTYSADEAYRAYKACKKESQIMIMGMATDEQLDWVIENGIDIFMFESDRLEKAIDIAKNKGKKARIHIEVETGFNRTGFDWDHREALSAILRANLDYLSLEGLCTHYAGAESIGNYVRVHRQIEKYHQFKNYFSEQGLPFSIYHTACSAAALSYPETIMDMVRIGIALYGFWPSQETYLGKYKDLKAYPGNNPLQRLLSWKSQVMSIKHVKRGEFIGYGTSFMAPRDMTIALVPVGYCHGFSRKLSNLGKVLVQGKILTVVGTVTMNSIAVDATDLKHIERGEPVVIIGKQKKQELTVASFGESSNQVNYELLTRLPLDIERRIVP